MIHGAAQHALRSAQLERIEKRSRELWQSGAVARWQSSADDRSQHLIRGVNGPLLKELAAEAHVALHSLPCSPWRARLAAQVDYDDLSCIDDIFISGAPLIGELPAHGSPATLLEGARKRNATLLASLRTDPFEQDLVRAVQKDVELGRMLPLVRADSLDLGAVVLTRRFGIQQGAKVRPIDDATEAGINAATTLPGACPGRVAHRWISRAYRQAA